MTRCAHSPPTIAPWQASGRRAVVQDRWGLPTGPGSAAHRRIGPGHVEAGSSALRRPDRRGPRDVLGVRVLERSLGSRTVGRWCDWPCRPGRTRRPLRCTTSLSEGQRTTHSTPGVGRFAIPEPVVRSPARCGHECSRQQAPGAAPCVTSAPELPIGLVDTRARGEQSGLVSDGGLESVRDHLLQALAGAVLLRDRLAETGDSEGTHVGLLTVGALNHVLDALAMDHPQGTARMLPRPGRPPVPGFSL